MAQSYSDWKKANPNGSFQQWKSPTSQPSSQANSKNLALARAASSTLYKTPSSSNPVISTSVKKPISQLKLAGGYAANASNPNANFYDSSQYKGNANKVSSLNEPQKPITLGAGSFGAAREYEAMNQPQNNSQQTGQNFGQNSNQIQNASQFYSSDAATAKRGNLLNELKKEGFSDQEILNLAGGGTNDVNKAVDKFLGISRSTRGVNGGQEGEFLEELDPMTSMNFAGILEKARGEKAIEKSKSDLLNTEGQIKSDLEEVYRPEFTAARDAGKRAQESDLRLAGRSAFGSATAERQTDINKKQMEVERSIAAQQRLEEQQQVAMARGASAQEINSINEQIASSAANRVKMQGELELQAAGIDQQAVEQASELEKQVIKDSLEAAKSGLIWDNEQKTYVKDPNKPDDPGEFDVHFETDNTGNVTQISTNKKTNETTTTSLGTVGKGDINGNSPKYQYVQNNLTGEEKIFDPSTGMYWPAGRSNTRMETSFFTPESISSNPLTGEPMDNSVFAESSPTSVSTGVKVIPDKTGNGGNCVLYARTKNPSLPYGLFDKNDKINAINKAGSKDWSKLKIGDTILSGEGSVGHAFQVMGFNKATNKIIIDEANYTPGKVTQGREISITDPILYGFIPNQKTQGPPVTVSENANEGQNPAITDQVQQASGKPVEGMLIAMAQQAGLNILDPKIKANIIYNYETYGTLPQEDPQTKLARENAERDSQWKMQDMQWKMQDQQWKQEDRGIQMSDSEWNKANSLRGEFDNQQAVKDFKTVQATKNSFENIIKSGVQGPADVSLVFGFMKALDPTSVVKQDEFDKAANSSGQFTPGTIWSKFNGKFKNGRFLSDEVRNDFLRLVEQSLAAKQLSYNQELQRYQGLSQQAGIDPSKVIYNYDQSNGANTNSTFSSPAPTSTPSSSGTSASKLNSSEATRYRALTLKAAKDKKLPEAEYKEWKALMAKNKGQSSGGGSSIPNFGR